MLCEGDAVGTPVGLLLKVGFQDGTLLGLCELVGLIEGNSDGVTVGFELGGPESVGGVDGLRAGPWEGSSDGFSMHSVKP